MIRACFSLLVVLALVPAAAGDSDDDRFLAGLVRRGYFDLAEAEILRRATGADRDLEILHLRLAVAEDLAHGWLPEDDAAPARAAFTSVRRALEPLVAVRAKIVLAECGIADARFRLNLAAQGPSDDSGARRAEAAKLLEAARKVAEAAADRAPREGALRSRALLRAGIALLERAVLWPRDGLRRASELQSAREFWERFIWDYDGSVWGAWAYYYMGLTVAEQGETGDALEYLMTAAGIPVQDLDDDLRDVPLLAAIHAGRVARESGEILMVARALETLSGTRHALTCRLGMLASLERTRCRLANHTLLPGDDAKADARRVIEACDCSSRRWARVVRRDAEALIREIEASR